jgi:hypothetical protein
MAQDQGRLTITYTITRLPVCSITAEVCLLQAMICVQHGANKVDLAGENGHGTRQGVVAQTT